MNRVAVDGSGVCQDSPEAGTDASDELPSLFSMTRASS